MAIQSRILFLLLLISAIYSSCKSKTNSMNSDKKEPTMSTNPLIDPWSGPYNGVPPFDKIKIEDFIPSLEMAMNQKREEINAITANPEKPNFKNTIEALEKTGLALKRFQGVYYVWTSNMATPALDSIQATVEPRFASFNDSIIQNSQLFARIEAIQNDTASLTAEEKRLWWRYHTTFVLAGAKMDAKSKERVAAINQQLASLFTKFSQNKVGSWVINNTRSAIEPFLTNCKNRSLREKAWRMFINRGDNGDANDNNAIIPQILALRAERAKLLGFETHAHLRLADKMAQTPEKALSLLESVWPFAIDRVKEEVTDMQKLADKMGDKIKIEAWDYRYYAEKVRKDKYDLDESEVKQYLELENLREGMFFMASELFNMKFTQIKDVPVFHPDVRVYRVNDIKSDKLIGLWYFDPYARQGKRSGAWMTAYREQEKLNGDITTIVSNNCNFLRGKENEPILISWEDAETLFHEFGHALHGLCSNVKYPSLSGTNVATDYVEFPSQILERWLSTKEILQKYALHYKTKEPMPQSLLDKIKNASKFNQGFATVEYLASALIDMKLHLAGAQKIDADKFERETLLALKMPKEMVMRHRTPQFGHIFADDGYSAGYYSYLWSEVLSADAWEAFTEAGGAYDKTVGKRLYDYVFSVGGTMDESTAYSLFRGKEPTKNALMKARGFKVE